MNPELSEAVRLYLGFGAASWPQANADAVAQRFADRSAQLNQQIAAILRDADEFRPDWSENDLAGAMCLAEDRLRKVRPELTEDAIQAVVWAWSYWNK